MESSMCSATVITIYASLYVIYFPNFGSSPHNESQSSLFFTASYKTPSATVKTLAAFPTPASLRALLPAAATLLCPSRFFYSTATSLRRYVWPLHPPPALQRRGTHRCRLCWCSACCRIYKDGDECDMPRYPATAIHRLPSPIFLLFSALSHPLSP